MEPEYGTDELKKIKIDLIVIGNSNSGKTSLIKRFIDGEKSFVHRYQPSIGLSLDKKEIFLGDYFVSLQIWDTAGEQKFFSITQNYFRKADGILVIFDLTDKLSFDSNNPLTPEIDKFWMQEIKNKATEDSSQIIIGNKVDLAAQRALSYEAGRAMADSFGLDYFETSAKNGDNIEEAINSLIRKCISKIKTNEATGVALVNEPVEHRSCFSNPKQFFLNLFSEGERRSKT